VTTPLSDKILSELRAGDRVSFDGVIYTSRDMAHQRLIALIREGEKLPFPMAGQLIYYASPTPAKAGHPIGSIGPSSSYRMDPYTAPLLEQGIRGLMGKGPRSAEAIECLRQKGAVYFATLGGLGALLARHVKHAKVVAFEELGSEAIYSLEVEGFPALVVNDLVGGDLYKQGPEVYRKL
jgi:fumarate hydratase subunit beta